MKGMQYSGTLLSLKTYQLPDFAGLAELLCDHCPHLAFIQEVSQLSSLPILAAVASCSVFLSTTLEPPKRTIAILVHFPSQVRDLTAGYVQPVTIVDLSYPSYAFTCLRASRGHCCGERHSYAAQPVATSLGPNSAYLYCRF